MNFASSTLAPLPSCPTFLVVHHAIRSNCAWLQKKFCSLLGDVHLDVSIVHSPSLSFVHCPSLKKNKINNGIYLNAQYHPHIVLVVKFVTRYIIIIIDNINPNDLINNVPPIIHL